MKFRCLSTALSAIVQRRRQSLNSGLQWTLAKTYQVISPAPADFIWKKLINLTDVSWHPLLASTDAPYGLVAKPGLIYRAVTRLIPFPIRIFVELVRPGEFLSVRILTVPGLDERVTYRIESTLRGTRISYSVLLRGWLSPLVWSVTQGYAAQVAATLAKAVEEERSQSASGYLRSPKDTCFDF